MSDLFVNESLTIPGAELGIRTSRSGGPGGQHVNKTSSRVSLSWDVAGSAVLTPAQRRRLLAKLAPRLTEDGVLQVHVDTERSQHRNREIARERLARIVGRALFVRPRRKPTAPSRAAKRRRIEEKKRRGALKQSRKPPGHES